MDSILCLFLDQLDCCVFLACDCAFCDGCAQQSATPRNKLALALHGLGQCASTADADALALLSHGLRHQESVFVQSTSAAALGFLGRRAAAEGNLVTVKKVAAALLPALSMEFACALPHPHPLSPFRFKAGYSTATGS